MNKIEAIQLLKDLMKQFDILESKSHLLGTIIATLNLSQNQPFFEQNFKDQIEIWTAQYNLLNT